VDWIWDGEKVGCPACGATDVSVRDTNHPTGNETIIACQRCYRHEVVDRNPFDGYQYPTTEELLRRNNLA
jgi:hypothetical protein